MFSMKRRVERAELLVNLLAGAGRIEGADTVKTTLDRTTKDYVAATNAARKAREVVDAARAARNAAKDDALSAAFTARAALALRDGVRAPPLPAEARGETTREVLVRLAAVAAAVAHAGLERPDLETARRRLVAAESTLHEATQAARAARLARLPLEERWATAHENARIVAEAFLVLEGVSRAARRARLGVVNPRPRRRRAAT